MTRHVHLHTWGPGMSGCLTCGMTRGRAARASQDRNTILKFLRSAEVGVALHQAKLDPVLYATVMQRLSNVADDLHEAAVTRSASTMTIAAKPKAPKMVGTPVVTTGPTGSITVTMTYDEP